MTDKQKPPKPSPKHQLLEEQLAELKLTQIAELYRQVLDDAARNNSSAFDVLAALVGAEVTGRRQRALQRRIREAKLPPRKTVEEFDFTFPKRIPKQKILRLCDCQFVTQRGCAVFIGPTGTGKTHFLTPRRLGFRGVVLLPRRCSPAQEASGLARLPSQPQPVRGRLGGR